MEIMLLIRLFSIYWIAIIIKNRLKVKDRIRP